MKREFIPVKFEGVLSRTLDELVNSGIYSTRSEAIREGLRLLAEKHGIKLTPAFYFSSLVREGISKKQKHYTKEELERIMEKSSKKTWKKTRKNYGF